MPDEARYIITIQGDGTGAIQAFDQVNASLQDFSGKLNDVKTQMTTPYEHAGMYLFSRQVLGLAGMGDVARHAMGAISAGLEEVGAAAGLAGGEFGLILLAVGAAILLFEKLEKSHKNVKDAQDELIKSEEKNLQNTKELSSEITKYTDAYGVLTPELAAVKVATDNLTEAQTKLLALDLQKQIDDTRTKIEGIAASFQPAINATVGAAAALDKYQAGSKEAATAGEAVNHVLTEQQQATAALDLKLAELVEQMDRYKKTGDISPTVQHLKDAVKAADENVKAVDEINKHWDDLAKGVEGAVDKMKAAETSLTTKTTEMADQDYQYTADSWDKKTAAAKRSLDTQLASIEQTYKKAHAAAEAYGIDDTELTNKYEAAKETARKLYQDRAEADTRAFFGIQASLFQNAENVGIQTFNQLANGVSTAFAKMVVEGKNMAQSLDQVFQNIAESFISAVAEMMIKWLAFKAVMGIMGAASMGASAGAEPMLPGMMASGGGLSVPGFADGGDFLATHPTLIAVGESGPERVTIVPSGMSAPSGGGASGGGGSINANIVVNAYGVSDPRELADQVAPYILDIIRGRGNLSFTGPNIG